MDGTFMLWSLLGLAIAITMVMALGANRRARMAMPLWWACLVLGSATGLYGLSHSTAPSFAPRITATGTSSALKEERKGRDSKFVFTFSPEGTSPIPLETNLILPRWSNASVFQGRTLRITYLNDNARSVRNEAIDIQLLSGENAGWHDSLDARVLGVWLAIPIGVTIGAFGLIGIRFRKDDLRATESAQAD